MKTEFDSRLADVYNNHFLDAQSILARCQACNRSGIKLTELDFALDHFTALTDQNHIGELDAAISIGRHLNLRKNMTLLDVGSGTGGTARVFAYLYGCKSTAIELNLKRHNDSKVLTKSVGLSKFIKHINADFTQWNSHGETYDAIIILDSLCHFQDKISVISKCLSLCKENGIIVVRDTELIKGKKLSERNMALLKSLNRDWNVAGWEPWHESRDILVSEMFDLTDMFRHHFHRMIDCSKRNTTCPPSDLEVRAWQTALKLADAGIIAYRQWTIVPTISL